MMRTLEQERPETRGGFVHAPLLPEQALDKPAASMPLELLLRAGRVIVATCARRRSGS
jgi:pyrrolidone-carboxylate peptidase